MEYDLYTVPRCEQCDAVKNFLDEQHIDYDIFNLKLPESKKHFGKNGYMEIDRELKRNVQHQPLLPLLIERRNGTVERFAQEFKGIKELFGGDCCSFDDCKL